MRVVAMFRVSTEKQANEGTSLDAQQRRYRELASANGWTTVAEFRGCESATGAATERRVLQQVLASLREGSPDAVYVHEQSRLTRGDELEVALLLRELRERQVKIIIGGVVRDLASIDERFMIGIQSLVDRAETERIRERMHRGRRERAHQGKKNCGPAPLGYTNPPPGDPSRGTLQVVHDEAEIVRDIFKLAVSGLSIRAIGLLLDEQGSPPPRGRRWGKTTITRILNNPAYIGTHASNVWVAEPGSRNFRLDLNNPNAILVENAHEPIIERELWDAVHARPKPLRTSKPRMLTGLLWVNGVRHAGDMTRGRHFYCARNNGRGEAWLNEDATDSAVWDSFVSLASTPEFVAKMIAGAREADPIEDVADQIRRQDARAAKLRKRLDRIVDMRADGEISKATFLRKTAETEEALEQTESALRDLRARSAITDASQADRVVRAVQTLIGGSDKLAPRQKRSILDSIVMRIDVKAVRSGEWRMTRGRGGRFEGKRGPRWVIAGISFQLALPAEDCVGGLVPSAGCCACPRPRRPRRA